MSGDTRNEDPEDFWSCVLSARSEPDNHARRRQRRTLMEAVRKIRRDERARILLVVYTRAQELADDATDALIHAPRMAASCRARRDEAKHMARAIRRLKP